MKLGMHKTIQKIAELIKKHKRVDIVLFCDKLNMGPSTFYNYKKFILARYHNITYENGVFIWKEIEEIEK